MNRDHDDMLGPAGQDDDTGPSAEPRYQADIGAIADLFLSEVRAKTGEGRVRPVRTPPGRVAPEVIPEASLEPSIEPVLTVGRTVVEAGAAYPDDHARAEEGAGEAELLPELPADLRRPACVMVGPHLSSGGREAAVYAVARALCGGGDRRAGVLRVDFGEAELGMVDVGLPSDSADVAEGGAWRDLDDAVRELTCDVDLWVTSTGASEGAAAGRVIRTAGCWVVPVDARGDARETPRERTEATPAMSDATDEGMVAAYRTLKILAGTQADDGSPARARLILAAVGRASVPAVLKLRAVMRKFLAWDAADVLLLDLPERARKADRDAHRDAQRDAARPDGEHVLMRWGSDTDPEAWHATLDRLLPGAEVPQLPATGEPPATQAVEAIPVVSTETDENEEATTYRVAVEQKPSAADRAPVPDAAPQPMTMRAVPAGEPEYGAEGEVLDYVGHGDLGVLDSVIAAESGTKSGMVRCDVAVPGGLVARLVCDRTGRLTLLVALGGAMGGGTGDMAEVGRVLGWVRENAVLIARAANVIGVDTSLAPHARLFLPGDKAKHLTQLLSPAQATVHTYRPLRWGPKRGLLLDAA